MSIRIKIEQHGNDTFKLTLDKGERSVSGVSVGLVAELLRLDDNNKIKIGKKDVAKLVNNTARIRKNSQDTVLLEALTLLSKG